MGSDIRIDYHVCQYCGETFSCASDTRIPQHVLEAHPPELCGKCSLFLFPPSELEFKDA
jgi:hypothetical protein